MLAFFLLPPTMKCMSVFTVYTAYHKRLICNSYGACMGNKQLSLLTSKLRAGYGFLLTTSYHEMYVSVYIIQCELA